MLFFDVISVAHGTKNEVSGDPQVNEPEPDLAEDMLLVTASTKSIATDNSAVTNDPLALNDIVEYFIIQMAPIDINYVKRIIFQVRQCFLAKRANVIDFHTVGGQCSIVQKGLISLI